MILVRKSVRPPTYEEMISYVKGKQGVPFKFNHKDDVETWLWHGTNWIIEIPRNSAKNFAILAVKFIHKVVDIDGWDDEYTLWQHLTGEGQ